MTLLLVLSFSLLVAGSGCGASGGAATAGQAVAVNGGAYRSLSPIELHRMLGHKDFLLVDVHSATGPRIPGTDEYVPYDAIQDNLAKLPGGKAARIIVYCQSGYMSAIAAKALLGLGYTNVFDLSGGMQGWQGQGYLLTEEAR